MFIYVFRDELVMKLDLCNDCHQGVGIPLPLGVVINKVGQLFSWATFYFHFPLYLRSCVCWLVWESVKMINCLVL
jgi:hypothetical protein